MEVKQEHWQQVYELLKGAQSQTASVQQSSEASLQSLESARGYATCLAAILRDKRADHSARWMAAIQLKNLITKHWKLRPGRGGIEAEEKVQLRKILLELIDQENQQLAVPIAICFAKVARADYPKIWPSLIQDILDLLPSGSTLLVRRCFLVLHHIIKELSSMRLAADRHNFEKVAEILYSRYWEQWCRDTGELVNSLQPALHTPQHITPLNLVFERWFLELKGLRRILLFGIKSDAKTLEPLPGVAEVTQVALQALQAFHALRPKNLTMRAQLHAMLDRALQKLAKFLHDVQETHPWSFYKNGCLKATTEFFCGVLTQEPQIGPAYDRFLMQAMIFLNDSLLCSHYKGRLGFQMQHTTEGSQQKSKIEEWGKEVTNQMQTIWRSGFSEAVCRSVIQYHLPLTTKELQEWADSPEEFQQQIGSGVWQDGLRSCAETLFTALIQEHEESTVPLVLNMFRAMRGSTATTSGNQETREGYPLSILAKEACCNAVALGCWSLMEKIDFSEWLHPDLLRDLHDGSPLIKPVRRRAGILVGTWATKLKPQDKAPVYRALLSLMADEDAAIALTGFKALCDIVEDWGFSEDEFLEFVEPCFRLAAQQLNTVTDYESQLQILNLVNTVLDRLDKAVKPFLASLVAMLPEIWRDSKNDSLLRMQILLALQRMVCALGLESHLLYPLILPILSDCFGPQQEDSLNLLEDSLHLWLILLRHAPSPDPNLFSPFAFLEAVMKSSTEHVEVAAAIMLSAILLGNSEAHLRVYGEYVASMLEALIGHLSEKGMKVVLPVLDVFLQAFPQSAETLLWKPLCSLLVNLLSGNEASTVVAVELGVIARLLVSSPTTFVKLVETSPANSNASEAFLNLWLERFDSLPTLEARKLSALAMCSLLQLPLHSITGHFTDIIACITSVFYEAEAGDNVTEFRMRLYPQLQTGFPESATVNSEDAEGEWSRLKALHGRDPVMNLQLGQIVKQAISALVQVQIAQGRAENALQSLPQELQSQLQYMIQS